MKRVVIHIDRLVLKGFRPDDRHAVGQGLQAELERVFSERDAALRLHTLGDVPRLQVVASGVMPQQVGQSVAQGIGREIQK